MSSNIRQRKPDSSKDSSSSTSKKSNTPSAQTSSGSFISTVFTFLFTALLLTLATSYLITDTFTFGAKLPNWRKYIPRTERSFTPAELATYDGTDPNQPIYLSLLGNVYDVTAGRDYYGEGGGYSFFAGRDATRSYITGCFKTHLTHDLRGLTPAQLKNLDQWTDMYANSDKYFYVGKVMLPEIDPESPIPKSC